MKKLLKLAVKFSRLSLSEKYCYLEAVLWLGTFRIALMVFPFKALAPWLGIHMAVDSEPGVTRDAHLVTKKAVSKAVETSARHLPWESRCLVRAMAGKKMLDRRKIPATLYLGVARAEASVGLRAHAWLRSGEFILTGDMDLDRFAVVSTFS